MILGVPILNHFRVDTSGEATLPICRVATVRETYPENEFFFPVRAKSGNFVDGQENLERTWKVRLSRGFT